MQKSKSEKKQNNNVSLRGNSISPYHELSSHTIDHHISFKTPVFFRANDRGGREEGGEPTKKGTVFSMHPTRRTLHTSVYTGCFGPTVTSYRQIHVRSSDPIETFRTPLLRSVHCNFSSYIHKPEGGGGKQARDTYDPTSFHTINPSFHSPPPFLDTTVRAAKPHPWSISFAG